MASTDTFRSEFKRSFLAGLGALFPAILTILILIQLFKFIDAGIGRPVNSAIKAQFRSKAGQKVLVEWFGWKREWLADKEAFARRLDEHYPNYIGTAFGLFVVTILIYFVGHMLRSYVGSRVFNLTDRFMTLFPGVRQIYSYAKQFASFVFQDKRPKFNTVAAVEYPRKGLYSIGFITGEGLEQVRDAAGEAIVSVFVPTSPTPLTGFVIMAPASEVIELDMTVEEAFTFTLTGGVIVPGDRIPRRSKGALTPPPEAEAMHAEAQDHASPDESPPAG